MISELQHSEYQKKIRELRQTLSWMDVVLSNIADAVAVIKYDNKLVFVNDAFADLVNQQRIALLGQSINDLLKLKPIDNAKEDPFKPDYNDEQKMETYRGTYEWHSPSKEKIILKLTVRYIYTTKQSVVMLQNVTEEQELETITRNFNNLASHQLRTPITAIKTYLHLLMDGYAGELTPEQKELAEIVMSSADHTNRLLSLLLDLSKLKQKKYQTYIRPIAISEILENVYTEIQHDIKAKSLKYTVKIPSNLPKIRGDKHAIHEIISNLVTNAIKYTPKEGAISIDAEESENNIVVSIQDTGIGIPFTNQNKIYTQFFRADNAVDLAPSGTGLGLYLVKQLVELMNGEITFKSQLHKGTVFYVKLPIDQQLSKNN